MDQKVLAGASAIHVDVVSLRSASICHITRLGILTTSSIIDMFNHQSLEILFMTTISLPFNTLASCTSPESYWYSDCKSMPPLVRTALSIRAFRRILNYVGQETTELAKAHIDIYIYIMSRSEVVFYSHHSIQACHARVLGFRNLAWHEPLRERKACRIRLRFACLRISL